MKPTYLLLPILFGTLSACAADRASSQLQTARADYRAAKSGPASQLELAALSDAQEALNRAEVAHADDPGSYEERSLAYLASHRARIAMAKAGAAEAKLQATDAEARHEKYQEALLEAQRAALQNTTASLEAERKAREEAEKRTEAALASLRAAANVQQDARGTVLTLSGSVLFVTGKVELLPSARERLDSIAKSLTELDSKVTFKIEGHTDSRGTDQFNEQLSQERAQSVADYLASRGVDRGRIQTVGMGESKPVASNDTPEGRANNRRVEIVIQDPANDQNQGLGSRPQPAAPGGSSQAGIPDQR